MNNNALEIMITKQYIKIGNRNEWNAMSAYRMMKMSTVCFSDWSERHMNHTPPNTNTHTQLCILNRWHFAADRTTNEWIRTYIK